MELTQIKIENFLSIGKTPVIVDFTKGLNIITGVNKDKSDRTNGIGKSTIVDAVFYSFFDKTLRELTKKEILNDSVKKGGLIEHTFVKDDVEYKICREIKPSKCQFFIDGEDVTRDTIANTNSYILEKLNIDETSFRNCVIMSVGNTTPFMAQKKIDRKKYIEGIFDINVFSDIEKLVRKDNNKLKTDIEVLNSSIYNIKKDIERYSLESDTFQSNLDSKLEKLELEIKENSIRLSNKSLSNIDKDQIQEKIKKIEDNISKIKLKKTENASIKEKLQKHLYQIEYKIKDNQKTINGLIKGGDCPICLRNIDDNALSHLKSHEDELQTEIDSLQEKIKTIRNGLNKCGEKLNKLDNMYDSQLSTKDKCHNELRNFTIIQNEIDSLYREQNFLDNRKTELLNTTNSFTKLKEDSEITLKTKEDKLENLCLDKKVLDIVSFVYGEKGVKSFIVKKVLDILNSKIEYYLSKMNINCQIIFDEYFDEQIITDKKTERSYSSFSSGERRSIDISIMFAFMDLQKLIGKFEIDTNFYDELIDSSLDEDGVTYVLDILKEKIQKENKKIYLITHRKEATKLADGEVIMLEKSNGITKRV